MVLPVLVLMLTSVAAWSRYQRDSMLDVLHTDYVRTARAKGVPRRQIIRRHALRNSLIPFVTVVAIDAGVLLGGVVVVERDLQLARARAPVLRRARTVRLPRAPGVDGGGDGVRGALQPVRRHPVRACSIRASGSGERRRVRDARVRRGRPHEHARRRRVGVGRVRSPSTRSWSTRSRWSPRTTGGEWRAAWRRFRHHHAALVGLGFLVFMVLACFVGAHFAPRPGLPASPRDRRRDRRPPTGSAPTSSAATRSRGCCTAVRSR